MGRGDLKDGQWAVPEPLLAKGARAGRPPAWSRRRLTDGIRFRIRTGVPWRNVPAEYGPWGSSGPRVCRISSPRHGAS
ncbi:transposase [Streptomyces sp. NPDC079020]|uniref:transposase n=1 Tax=Streptomyces sp. NPDC079020 TaxID=3365722 RepID=UPI0037D0C027